MSALIVLLGCVTSYPTRGRADRHRSWRGVQPAFPSRLAGRYYYYYYDYSNFIIIMIIMQLITIMIITIIIIATTLIPLQLPYYE